MVRSFSTDYPLVVTLSRSFPTDYPLETKDSTLGAHARVGVLGEGVFNCQRFVTFLAVLYPREYGKIKILGDWACGVSFFSLSSFHALKHSLYTPRYIFVKFEKKEKRLCSKSLLEALSNERYLNPFHCGRS